MLSRDLNVCVFVYFEHSDRRRILAGSGFELCPLFLCVICPSPHKTLLSSDCYALFASLFREALRASFSVSGILVLNLFATHLIWAMGCVVSST